MRAYLQLRSPDGDSEHELPARRAVVGTGPADDVVLPAHPDLGPAHFAVEPADDGCRVEVLRAAPTSLTVEGLSHERGTLPWGTEVRIGALSVRLARDREATRRRPSIVLLLAPVILGVALWSIFSDADATGVSAAPEAPPLFEAPTRRCESGSGPAHARAERDEEAGRAKMQRYPFDGHDGVAAVELLRHAHACYAAAGDGEARARVEELGARLEARVTSDYEAARFRLGRALAHEDWTGAAAEAATLLELLAGRGGPYVEWLTTLERRLRLGQAGP